MDPAFAQSIEALADWVGKQRIADDEISVSNVRKVAAMLDLDPQSFEEGTPLPPHWVWLFCHDIIRQSELGRDGHPAPGVVLPPIPLPRRMGAGRRVQIFDRLIAGQSARRIAEVASITPKAGRTGNIAVLTMRHTIESGGKTIAIDEFDAVYRGEVEQGQSTAASPPRPAPENAAWSEQIHLAETLVFRFSALTWNAHRIHYDSDYSQGTEGYPHTVQNGGLTMHLLVDAALRQSSGRLKNFSARLTGPLFVGDTVTLAGESQSDGKLSCWAANHNNELCGLVDLEFET